mmetsp:Transcript_11287/g.20696  ORF Transcript_11287/g.20696 Transcript_11287/m.20696 type:complete len:340 (+) Transcript_11287:48-1067(+)
MRPSLFFTTSLTLSSHLRHGVRVRAASSLQATTTRQGDGTIIIAPDDDSRHSATVILCHGLGDTADGWTDPAQFLAKQLPHVKFILPTAPTQPVTLNMGMAMPSWYDIIGLDSRSNEVCNGLDESMDRIVGLMEEEAGRDTNDETSCKSSPVDYSRIVLAGFSQGGALALYTGMTQHRNKQNQVGLGLAGIVVMSGYLPRSKQFAVAPGSERTPILHCHGKEDSVVPVQATELSRARVLEEMDGKDTYEVKTYPGLDHSVSMDELNDVAAFLKRVLPTISDANISTEKVGNLADPAQMSVRQLKDAIRQAGLDEQAKGMFEKSELIDLLSKHLKETMQH